MTVTNHQADENSETPIGAHGRLAAAVIDLTGLLAILATVVALVVIVGPAATAVLATAGVFVAAALRIWLRRR